MLVHVRERIHRRAFRARVAIFNYKSSIDEINPAQYHEAWTIKNLVFLRNRQNGRSRDPGASSNAVCNVELHVEVSVGSYVIFIAAVKHSHRKTHILNTSRS
jgi:hypothetical protein